MFFFQRRRKGADSGSSKGSAEEDPSVLSRRRSFGDHHMGSYMESQSSQGSNTPLIPRELSNMVGCPIVLVMVGLPARGKSYITKKLVRYLTWRGFKCKEFNAGNKRRDMMDGGGQSADFFQGSNEKREDIAMLTFQDLVHWLEGGGHVAVFDATNTTVNRRDKVREWCKKANLPDPVFVESICDDEQVLDRNYRMKLANEDYKHTDHDVAMADFLERVRAYEKVYEPVGTGSEGDNFPYIKLFNVGLKVVVNRCYGFLTSQIVTILQNFHINPRRIFLTRHGESEDNEAEKLGGNSKLTPKGVEYARRLAAFIQDQRSDSTSPEFMVATSAMRRAIDTVKPLKKAVTDQPVFFLHTNQLNEIHAGSFEGMSYEEIKFRNPKEFAARQKDKLGYRYPMGESYLDVIMRLSPWVLDLERLRQDVLVVSHQACLRAVMGYFLGTDIEQVPYLDVPLHCVLEMTPEAYGCKVVKHDLFAE